MAAEVHEGAREIPMSWEDYLALGEGTRGEYVDGKMLVSPRGTYLHQRAAQNLTRFLGDWCAAGEVVVQEWAWRPEGMVREYQPDVMVLRRAPTGDVNFTVETPVLVAEVTSPSNASKDWVRNMRDYAKLGVPGYWILDHGDRCLYAFELRDGEYVEVGSGPDVVHAPGRLTGVDIDVAQLWY